MAQASLNLHSGGHLVTLDELREVKAPPPEGRWFPLAHAKVVDTVAGTLKDAGYVIESQQLAVARNNHRFFGTLTLGTPLVSGVQLAVGIRNSTDKSFPLGFCAGSRVFVCSNLAFRSELLVKRKHTRFGEQRFTEAIAGAVTQLTSFRQQEADRIKRFMLTDLTDDQADALILRSFEKGIISAPLLPKVIAEWRKPSFEEFEPRTVWSLFNAFTTILRPRTETVPAVVAGQTMRLNALLDFRPAEPHLVNAV